MLTPFYCFLTSLKRQPTDRNGKEVQMLVQRSQVGSVIGRGGYKIKETREVIELKLFEINHNYFVRLILNTFGIALLVHINFNFCCFFFFFFFFCSKLEHKSR